MSNSFFEKKLDKFFRDPKKLSSNLDALEQLLKEIEAAYQAYLDKRYPDGKVFFMFQNVEKNEGIDFTLPASQIIKKAYPIVEFDEQGNALDNREQGYIDTVKQFLAGLDDRHSSEYSQVDEDISQATAVFGASSGLFETTRKLRNAIKEQDDDTIEPLIGTCQQYGQELEEALVVSAPSVMKELELNDSWGKRMILQLKNLISAILHPFKKAEESAPEEKPILLADAGCYLGKEHARLYPKKTN